MVCGDYYCVDALDCCLATVPDADACCLDLHVLVIVVLDLWLRCVG